MDYNKTAHLPAKSNTTFELKFISDGNEAVSHYRVEGGNKIKLVDAKKIDLGTSADLVEKTFSIYTVVDNIVPEETHIAVQYLINDEVIVDHSKAKGGQNRQEIYVEIKFQKA